MLQLENFALKIAFWAISGPNMPVVAVHPHCAVITYSARTS